MAITATSKGPPLQFPGKSMASDAAFHYSFSRMETATFIPNVTVASQVDADVLHS
jgi:hypothetical protein